MHLPYSISPLSEQCALVQWPQHIDAAINRSVMSLHTQLNRRPFAGFVETVPAYSSLAVFYDVMQVERRSGTAFEFVRQYIEQMLAQPAVPEAEDGALIEIPVRYGGMYGSDIADVATANGIGTDDVIALHTGTVYRVFMMGFMPGFPYMGVTHEKLNIGRKAQPRAEVAAGSVGLAGRQTGIYPFASPGGWQIIGQTDITLFDAGKNPPCLLQPGMRVRFVAV